MKVKYVKQALATVLAVTLLAGGINNLPVQAAETQEDVITGEILEDQKATGTVTDSGTCGENATWTYEDGVLTISGSGVVTWEKPIWGWTPWYSYQEKITSIIIENGITSFSDSDGEKGNSSNERAFVLMPQLERVSFPESLERVPKFASCSKLKEIEIPNGVKKISETTFYMCKSLEKVIAKNVTEIDDLAFYGCENLREIVFADNVQYGSWVFSGCSALADENGLIIVGNILMDIDDEKIGASLVIPEGVKEVRTVGYSNKIESVIFPSTLQIDNRSDLIDNLSRLWGLKKIEVTEGNSLYSSVNGCLFNKGKTELLICPKAMEGSCIIPQGVEKIGYDALSNCAYLTEVMIPASVKRIEKGGCNIANSAPIYFKGDAVEDTEDIFYDQHYDSESFLKYYAELTESDLKLAYTEELETIAQKKIYYVEGTSGWDALKAKYPRVQWLTWDGNNIDAGRTVPYYSLSENGGTWDGTHYTKTDGTVATDIFFFDGSSTYYLQADGTPMKDTLTYHPDGKHLIYLDSNGHEVFNSFQYCPSVGYTCYFDSQGYLYKDQITFVGNKTYYLNANGKLENEGWFRFANGMDYGFANWDGTLNTSGFSYDPWGRVVFYHWNGMVARGLITDGQWYYLMDETDGHYLGSFPVN